MECINCKKDFEGKFCPECGEKKNIERITFSSVFATAFAGITQMDKGFLYNLKNLTIRPKETILKYIDGKRKYIFNPISYALLSISLYLIITDMFDFDTAKVTEEVSKPKKGLAKATYSMAYEGGKFLAQKIKYFWLFNTVYLSVFTKIFLRKFNFVEHLAINSFIIGQSTLLGIVSYLLFHFEIIFDPIILLAIIILLFSVHSNKKNRFEVVTLTVLAVFFTYLFFILTPVLINLIWSKVSS